MAPEPIAVALDRITKSQRLWVRFAYREERVAELEGLIADGVELDPIELTDLSDGRLILTNGWHREAATRRAGKTTIMAVVTPGTEQDALIRAATADAKAAMPRTPDERKKAVRMLLGDPEIAQSWSYARISRETGVRRDTVAQIYRELYPGEGQRQITVERGGQSFPLVVDTGRREPARPAPEALNEPAWTESAVPESVEVHIPTGPAPAPESERDWRDRRSTGASHHSGNGTSSGTRAGQRGAASISLFWTYPDRTGGQLNTAYPDQTARLQSNLIVWNQLADWLADALEQYPALTRQMNPRHAERITRAIMAVHELNELNEHEETDHA